MATLKEICDYTNVLLQSASIPDYCPNGLQVEGRSKVTHIATAVSASLATIQAAVKSGAHLLLVHHGLFWTGDDYAIVGAKHAKLKQLLDNQLSLVAYHLPLDMHPEYGNNWKAALDMGWGHLEPFGLVKGLPIGVRGTIRATTRDKIRWQLEEYYQHPAHCALGGPEKVCSLALISGGAHKHIQDALAAEVDCFITGSFDEPVWHQAYEGRGINFFAMGHSATEKIGPKALGEHLQDRFDLKHTFIDIPNPF